MRVLLICLFMIALFSEENIASDVQGAQSFNALLSELKGELRSKFEDAEHLALSPAPMEDYQTILKDVCEIRRKIKGLEEKWRKAAVDETSRNEEPYAMWDVGETTLSQLIMEYGASDFLYVSC